MLFSLDTAPEFDLTQRRQLLISQAQDGQLNLSDIGWPFMRMPLALSAVG